MNDDAKIQKKIFALRGAAFAQNSKEDIDLQSVVLFDELLKRNNLEEKDIVSVIFSVTPDLNALNPASALRMEGRTLTAALFVVQEACFEKSPNGVIRIMIHCYLDIDSAPVHVYRNGAEILRPDRKN